MHLVHLYLLYLLYPDLFLPLYVVSPIGCTVSLPLISCSSRLVFSSQSVLSVCVLLLLLQCFNFLMHVMLYESLAFMTFVFCCLEVEGLQLIIITHSSIICLVLLNETHFPRSPFCVLPHCLVCLTVKSCDWAF